ncbi:MAG: 4Fe-4S binding protein [Coriobacteriia bacterium]|nr:4Fe-4S binding protein [Coriobacteriia bacterium]
MTTVIYYFSGTGNSLLTGRKLLQRLDGAELLPMMTLAETLDDPVRRDADAIGLVFPVYFDRIPEIVRTLITAAALPADAYYFAITTSGEPTGNALHATDMLLRSRGARLAYGANLALADNSIVAKTSEAKAAERFAQLDAVTDDIAAAVNGRVQLDVRELRDAGLAAFGHVSSFGFMYLYGARQRAVDSDACTRCGQCATLCPVNNITVTDEGVRIGSDCVWCFACLNWCPHKAIRFGKIDPAEKGQYRCRGIRAGDIRTSVQTKGTA